MALVTNAPGSAASSPAAIVNDIRDIAPPVDISNGWEWLWCALITLGVVALAWWAWRKWRHHRAHIPIIPPLPAHVRAKQRLQEALALIAQPKPFVIAVSDVARTYLEERFNFHAPERTTEEFLHELQRTDRLTRGQKERMGEFLQGCDLVKFAKYEPGEQELRDLHAAALRLVEETEPVEIPSPESRVQSPQPA